jgi:hypothetical protein
MGETILRLTRKVPAPGLTEARLPFSENDYMQTNESGAYPDSIQPGCQRLLAQWERRCSEIAMHGIVEMILPRRRPDHDHARVSVARTRGHRDCVLALATARGWDLNLFRLR